MLLKKLKVLKRFIKPNFKKYISTDALNNIKTILGSEKLYTTNPNVLHSHGSDVVGHKPQPPDIVIFPENINQISSIAKYCNQQKIPIIPYGAGTSLEGNFTAPNGGVSIDMSKMNQIIELNDEDMNVTVQAGMTREELNHLTKDTGLFFPIDPGANASIGGMVSTRASGTNAVRYGTMKENVVSLKVILPDGEVITTSRRAKKSSAGYDLTSLFIGSEGTLGIVAEITLKLYGIPTSIISATCTFDDIEGAANTVISLIQFGIPIARVEILDETCIKAVNKYSKLSLPVKPTLFFEFHGSENSVEEQCQSVKELAIENGGNLFNASSDSEERNKLWKARHDAYWASTALIPDSKCIVTDVCVPISNLATCITETKKDMDSTGLTYTLVGHVGDGNFHLIILFTNEEEYKKVEESNERLIHRSLSMKGTCTGEHGIGIGKKKFLTLEHGEKVVDLMKTIKLSIDPNNIMNPNKIF